MIDPPQVWLTSISPTILEFGFSLHMVKDDWPPGISPKILKLGFSLHMVEDDWLPQVSHLKF